MNTIDEHRSKIDKTEFSIAIYRQLGDKWQSKTLFLAIFDQRSAILKSVFDCRITGVVIRKELRLIMAENKTILFICVSVCICQAVIWRIYVYISTVSVDISKMDGIISDPRNGLVAVGANCSTTSKGEWTCTTLETQSSRYVKPTYVYKATKSRLLKSQKNKE